MPLSPDTQKKLYAETDARFAAQTHITRKLDPQNPLDQKLIPLWTQIYNQVARDYNAGIIAWTSDNPFVQKSLEAASILTNKAADHFEEAVQASVTDSALAGFKLAAADMARRAASIFSASAAQAQPPTVDPQLAAATAANVVATAGPPRNGADAVAALQASQAGGAALGVHTPGDPNPLHFQMQGGQQAYGGGGAAAEAGVGAPKDKTKGVVVAAVAIGGGLLLSGLVMASRPSPRRSSGSGGGSRTVVLRRDRVYGGR